MANVVAPWAGCTLGTVQILALIDIVFGLIWGVSLFFLFIVIWLPVCGFYGARTLQPGTSRWYGVLRRHGLPVFKLLRGD